MGLITKEIEVNLHPSNIKHYENAGYKILKKKNKWGKIIIPKGSKILVKVNDLSNGSTVKVDIECDNCYKKIKNQIWADYLKCLHDGKYYCKKCSSNLYGTENYRKSRLKNGNSFEQWCLDNNRKDVLDRWDYELNDCKPNEIGYSTNKKYYFKCSRGLHKSELKSINSFTSGKNGVVNCKQCNSFAQWGIDNLGEDFLEKYWDYEKNDKLGINPWKTAKSSNSKKVYIKCQKKDYHGSYPVFCNSFTKGNRCPYCSNRCGKVHPLDSLGTFHPEVLEIWSNKNKKTPFEYSPNSSRYVYWKCPEDKHEDYYRCIYSSNSICGFRCPECQYSKGEERISNYLINKGFIKVSQDEFSQLIDKDKYSKKYYISQKEFDGLVGLGNRNLSYDFYLPKYNLLIEYQGEQHERYIPGFHKSKKDFEKQLEHDRRKREHAKENNINLLEIWYWDFDNIDKILSDELNI